MYSVVTLHRPSNVDVEIKVNQLISHLVNISHKIPIVFPMHPRTRNTFERFGKLALLENEPAIHLLEPLGYLEFVSLLGSSTIVITDSGGLQEETTSLGIPCLTLRENTERPITITEGTNQLVSDLTILQTKVETVLTNDQQVTPQKPMFWDGRTAERIVNSIVSFLEW